MQINEPESCPELERKDMSEPTPRTDRTNKFVSRESGITWVEIEFARLLERELAAKSAECEQLKKLNALSERNGELLDSMWCCKVCDGEIPDGHTDNCDIWKLEKTHREFIANEYNTALERAAQAEAERVKEWNARRDAEASRDAAKAAAESLRVDAERYRWLRKRDVLAWKRDGDRKADFELATGWKLDEHIDAAKVTP
jgi:hypothetical protein